MKKGLFIIGVMMVFVVQQTFTQNTNTIIGLNTNGSGTYYMQELKPFVPYLDYPPRYKLFYIFGDGTYSWGPERVIPHNITGAPLVPTQNITHHFPKNDTFTATCYITAEYDNEPPPSITPPIDITITGYKATVTPNQNHLEENIFPPFSYISIYNNHENRPKYETVNVVSTKPTIDSKKLFLFYGSKVSSSGMQCNSTTGKTIYQRTHLANYSSISSLTSISGENLDNTIGTDFKDNFENVIIYDISNDGTDYITQHLDEHRIFHILKTASSATIDINEKYRVLAILTSSNSYDLSSHPQLTKLKNILDSNYVNPRTINVGANTGEYIQDFVIFDQDVVGMHDPNGLELIDLCSNCSNTEYKLSFELEFCNNGAIPTKDSFYIRILDKNHEYTANIYIDSTSENMNDILKINTDHQNDIHSILIKGKPLGTNECGTLYFSLITDDEEACQNINLSKSSLESCVSFHSWDSYEHCEQWKMTKEDITNQKKCTLCLWIMKPIYSIINYFHFK